MEKFYDDISPEVIKSELQTEVFGQNIFYYEKINSTNSEAKRLIKENAPHGSLVIAEEQGAGRGRLERAFYTPAKMGLWFSVILYPKFNITDAPKCTLLIAVAVALAMEEIGLQAEIKWPNDVMKDNKKLAGILTELVTLKDNVYSVIIGAGINVNFTKNDFPENLRDTACSIAIIKGEKLKRAKFLQRVLFFMENLYNKAETNGFYEVLNLWRKYSITLGKNIRIINGGDGEEITGRAVDIDEDGALIADVNGKFVRILAGDVSIREAGRKN